MVDEDSIFILQGFLQKLKQHLLDRITPTLPQDATNENDGQVLFRHDRIYQHSTMRINFTTYDVRRAQDVVNPSTSHCNVMLLNNDDDSEALPACSDKYARVLGIYHVNAVYVGHGMTDYQPRRMEFIWARWYRQVEPTRSGWRTRRLDRVQFLPTADDDAFGFIDPSQVLRGCHLIPAFNKGKAHADGKGLSVCAQDAKDWRQYYVNR